MPGKKFFQSKIDFMAPVKSLQNRSVAMDPLANHLSDDSFYEAPPAKQGQLRGPPTVKGSDTE